MQTTTASTPKPTQRRSRLRWLASLPALACAAAGLAISIEYPIAQPGVPVIFAALTIFFYLWPGSWLVTIPAMLPLIGFAPWTGWVTFEELDLLVLAACAAGYVHLALRAPAATRKTRDTAGATPRQRPGMSAASLLALTLFLVSVLVAMFRGFTDAGGFQFGWFQGYLEPMNSVRLAKSFLEALLLVPVWRSIYKQHPQRAQSLLSQGLMLGLCGAALATVWERAAFTGLLNFSADYRTTGLFWEMHVGGAALDGFLALTMPFALRELLVARTPARWSLAATALALGAYACLTTFSRGVYLAIPMGTAVMLGLHVWQQKQFAAVHLLSKKQIDANLHPIAALLIAAGFGLGAAWLFPTSGYRGMATLLVTMVLMLPMAHVLRGFKVTQWLQAITLGMALLILVIAVSWLAPNKGAYLGWGLSAILTVAMLVLLKVGVKQFAFAGPLAFAGFSATAAGMALVANHWGETPGLLHAVPVVLVVLCACVGAGATHKPFWPASFRWQATLATVMGLMAAIVGIFSGGAYMNERFSTSGQDLGGRIAHWQMGRDMLETPSEWWLGKGLGRFPANYLLTGNPQEHPGSYRLKVEGESTYITLAGGLHTNGVGEILRVTQRITPSGNPMVFSALIRAAKDASLHFEVCEKHLLYNQGCVVGQSAIKGAPGVWQTVRLELLGEGVSRGNWYAPRLLAFSMAMESRGGLADLKDVALTGSDGRQLLANGDFSKGMAHWFFSSDRYHLPWHIKSVFMNVLFDQGLIGLALWALLYAGALWRLGMGQARKHPLAPALAGALVGFAVVGLFDSLLDVPRVAWVYYTLLLISLTLRSPRLNHTAQSSK